MTAAKPPELSDTISRAMQVLHALFLGGDPDALHRHIGGLYDEFAAHLPNVKDLERAVTSREHTQEWYGHRWERLADLLRPTPYWSDAACIMANGTLWNDDPLTYPMQMNMLRWERDGWKKRALKAEAALDGQHAQD
ncbi:hypothetical protein [Deinococcus sp. PEB2-67]